MQVELWSFGHGNPPGPLELAAGMRVYLKACALLWLLAAVAGTADMYWSG